MNQRELTTKALNQLEFHTGLIAKVTEYGQGDSQNISALVEFNNNHKLVAELRRWTYEGNLDAVIAQLAENTESATKIYISNYINDELGMRLREAKVNYLDKAGNAYLDISPIFILIEGKIPKESFLLDKTAKLFTETGLKVICALLTNQDLLNANYRTIADHADVSMGTIGWVLRELRDQGFTQESYRNRSWKDKTKLIKKWAEEYPKLRVKNQLGVYYCKDENWWQSLDLAKYDAVLGGEIAALNHIDGIEPREGLIYLGKYQQRNFIRNLNLISPEQGENTTKLSRIELRSKFWGCVENVSFLASATHPLITFADLMDTWEARNIQHAKAIADDCLFE